MTRNGIKLASNNSMRTYQTHCFLPISTHESLDKLIGSHFDAALDQGVLPSIQIDQTQNSVAFVSHMIDHSELMLKIDRLGASSWLATIEVHNEKQDTTETSSGQ